MNDSITITVGYIYKFDTLPTSHFSYKTNEFTGLIFQKQIRLHKQH